MKPIILLIITVLNIYLFLLVARVIYGWLYAFNVINSSNQFVNMVGKFLYDITEPVLKPIYDVLYRRLKFPSGGIDVSPVVLALLVMLVIQYLEIYVLRWVP